MGVGMRLKTILRRKHMTIKELSEEAEIPLNTLYSITKRDSERVDSVILCRIAETLDVEIGELDGSFKGRGIKLKKIRDNLEISEKEFADRTGIPVHRLRKYESGEQEITTRTWNMIENKLQLWPGGLEYMYDLDIDIEEELKVSILRYFDLLNTDGKFEACRRMEELTLLPRYQGDGSEPPETILVDAKELDAYLPRYRREDTPEGPAEAAGDTDTAAGENPVGGAETQEG